MDDLVKWLREQLDEDEQAAKTWPEDQQLWEERGSRHLSYASGSGEQVSAISVGGDGPLGWERIYVKRDGVGLAAHIACHDPARVLREVESKRGVLRQYEAVREQVRNPVSAENRWAARIAQGELEDVLRLLAVPYSDRPGYREEWRP